GGQDLLDISGFGITAATFAANVAITITGTGANTVTLVDIVGLDNTITLQGVNGNGQNVITAQDFILAA
ncbi:MAG TPA: hypothetical protein VLC55_04190, partial [Burkholderiales bacterium]|nr:hypothetical protein [Burkholderiales bacterium]